MINLELDPQGRLTYFQVIPDQKFQAKSETSGSQATAPDWKILLDAAGLDPSKLQPAQPAWNPLASFDARAAWTGSWPGTTRPLRVEAASFQGKPVFFSLIGELDQARSHEEHRAKNLRAETYQACWIDPVIFRFARCWISCPEKLPSRTRRSEGSLRLAMAMFRARWASFSVSATFHRSETPSVSP